MITNLSDSTQEREQRLDAAAGSYLQALAAGRPGFRHELLTRNPDLAAELAQFLADLDAVGRLAAPLRQIPSAAPRTDLLAGDRFTVDGGRDAQAPAPHVKPAVVGDYELLEEIGRGGMGVVYKARHRGLGRLAAVKMLRADAYAGPEARARFHTEAQATSRL